MFRSIGEKRSGSWFIGAALRENVDVAGIRSRYLLSQGERRDSLLKKTRIRHSRLRMYDVYWKQRTDQRRNRRGY